MKATTLSIIITTPAVIIISIMLCLCCKQGLHPNIQAWLLMIPCMYALVWAKATLTETCNMPVSKQVTKRIK